MTIEVACPACRALLACPDDASGMLLRCYKCHHVFRANVPPRPPRRVEIPTQDEPVLQPSFFAPAGEVLWWKGNRIAGLSKQAGVIVLRPGFVAFLPSEGTQNLVGVLAKGMADTVFRIPSLPLDWLSRRPDPLQLVTHLWTQRPDRFDERIREVARQAGGSVWSRNDTSVAVTGKAGRAWRGVIFMHDKAELRGYAPGSPLLERLLDGWQESAPPIASDVKGLLVVSVLPLLLAVALYIGHLSSDDVPYWAPFVGLALAGLLYLVAGFIVARHRLSRKRRLRA
jgi:hypothetical protein